MSTIKSHLNRKEILKKNKMLDQKLIRQNEKLMQALKEALNESILDSSEHAR